MADPKLTLELERWLLGELSPQEDQALRARVGDGALAAVRARHEAEQAAMLEARPPRVFGALVRARAAAQAPRSRKLGAMALAPGLVLAAAALVLVLRTPQAELDAGRSVSSEPADRTKGIAPSLLVYRKQGTQAEPLREGARVRAGDVLQLAYVAGGHRYGIVLSIDGAGAVTLHSPAEAHGSTVLVPQGKHTLAAGYQLDEAPEFERFFFVVADTPLDTARVLEAARELAHARQGATTRPLALARGLEQVSFLLRKEAP